MKRVSRSREETKELAQDFIKSLKPEAEAIVVALHGDLGSGKTTFSQFIGQALGVGREMPSPTFLIERVYELTNKPWQHLVHIDAYRLEKESELSDLGWTELIKKRGNLILVEWAERVKNILPASAIHIVFTHEEEDTRTIEIQGQV